MTKIITIPNPKTFEYEENMVLIPKKEYETLIYIKSGHLPETTLTSKQKKAILASEKELASGKYFTLNELEKYLARPRSKTRR